MMEMPDWFGPALADAMAADKRARLEALPPTKFLFGRDYHYGPDAYAFGVMWDKDPNPPEGCYIYRRCFVFHLTFRISLERRKIAP